MQESHWEGATDYDKNGFSLYSKNDFVRTNEVSLFLLYMKIAKLLAKISTKKLWKVICFGMGIAFYIGVKRGSSDRYHLKSFHLERRDYCVQM